MDKNKKLLHVMDALQPYLAIIFMNTKQNADQLATYLAEHGHKPGKIHGDLTPRERTRVMKKVRDLEYQYIVATDLAARGIDIPGVSHVINFELPDDLEFFVHRVGRTARAGMQGHAITLYEPSDEDAINQIEKLGIPFIHEDVKNGEWIEVKERQARKKRVREVDEIDKKADSYIRKPDKVKPGYKKKMAEQKENFKRRQRRIKKKS